MSGRSKFSLHDYEVQFDKVMVVAEARQLFADFLKKNLTEESLLFIHDVDEFKRIEDKKEQVTKILVIVDTYILKGAKKEINIDGRERELIEKQIAESKQRENTDTIVVQARLFDRVYPLILQEMKQDSFARFIRSVQFSKFANQKGEDFIKQIAIHVSLLERKDILILFSQRECACNLLKSF